MGFFKYIKELFTGAVGVDKVFSSVSKGLDELNLTAEERADSVRDFVKETLSENSERSRARRIIAIMLIINYVAIFWFALISYFINPDVVETVITIVSKFSLDWAFLAVIAFFYGGYYLGKSGFKKPTKEK